MYNPRYRRNCSIIAGVAAAALLLAGCNEQSEQAAPVSAAADAEVTGQTGQLTGEGATSQQKAMEYFRAAYGQTIPGASFDYTATGSGAGQKQFINGTVDFGGSDSPLNDEQQTAAQARCNNNPAWHLPLVIGPVAVAYHLSGVDTVVLSPPVIAQIFAGTITTWNDPAIAALNEGVSLPDTPIAVIYRSEESGTSDNFQKFLTAAAPGQWSTTGKSFPTATGAGANGSKGVVTEVAATEGAITYVEAGFTRDVADVNVAAIDFGAGPVALDPDSVGIALDNLTYVGSGHDMVVDAKQLFAMQTPGAYPLVLTTYEIVCSKGYEPEVAARVKDFLSVALSVQDDTLAEKGYIPVQGDYKAKLEAAVAAIE
ncbi:phosphate ABC transporter substrate-binding protein PstS [Corynebacterium choanae]|uniref:Phosphate-binding protein n=1 Tax=Corynebacterium choanae TaxID=1862358 RepID=A0A3G6J4G0_9CORY|nr:phosphate ABC transporter substrate-binding protein PstS [Corynebacterium choanae]AZA12826.1 Phosphate-binding protein PstS 2 precursor [Corynebacterium choanae]